MTQMIDAINGIITREMRVVASKENLPVETIMKGLADGTLIIPKNKFRENVDVCAIGKGTKTKINVNLGISSDEPELEKEFEKVDIAEKYGADTIMDLSAGRENIHEIRKKLINRTKLPIGTVPVYQVALEVGRDGPTYHLNKDKILEVVEQHAKDGVDYMTLHTGITLRGLEKLKKQGRITNIVSRGGGIISSWMLYHKKENPFYELYPEFLELAKKYDFTISLGDGLRPGCLHDATDDAQLDELMTIGEQVRQAREVGVQVMVEGPGHVPFNQIKHNMQMQKSICSGAPFYVLGPLVTDVAPGYDHITGAIGATVAGTYGADLLCYITPAEHLRLPTPQDVRDGTIAFRIAAHAADIAKGIPNSRDWDDEMSRARQALDWEEMYSLAIDPEKARKMREESFPANKNVCTMCGGLCPMHSINLIEKSPLAKQKVFNEDKEELRHHRIRKIKAEMEKINVKGENYL